jgi:hypothetical protein
MVEGKIDQPEFLANASILLPADVDILKRFFELVPLFGSTSAIDSELEGV